MTTSPVRAWRGIRYATAERFAAPVDVEGWDPSQPYDAFGAAPFQIEQDRQPVGAVPAEDSHFLNVWAPTDAEGPLPVYVSVYGGGFENGSGSQPVMDGTTLAATGRAVVVTLNYRVGSLGFLTLAGISDAFPEASNLGLRDVISALRWVRRSIADFGGDPDRVTVGGESAGGFLVAALPAAPSADGAYARLAVHSAGASRVLPLAHAAEMARGVVANLAGGIDAVRTADPLELIAAQRGVVATDIGVRNGPAPQALGVVDDHELPNGVLTRHPAEAVATGAAAATPLLVSAAQDEIALFRVFAGDAFAPASRDDVVRELLSFGVAPDRAEEICASYAAEVGEGDLGLLRERMLTDYIYRLPSARLADEQARAGGSAHLFLIGEAGGSIASHAVDVPALMGLHLPDQGPEQDRRDDEITRIVVDFVTGEPLDWPAWGPEGDARGVGELRAPAADTFRTALARWEGVARP